MRHLEATGQRKLCQAQSPGRAPSIRDGRTSDRPPVMKGYVVLVFYPSYRCFSDCGLTAMESLMMPRKDLKARVGDSIAWKISASFYLEHFSAEVQNVSRDTSDAAT